jgi:hypothetical protein
MLLTALIVAIIVGIVVWTAIDAPNNLKIDHRLIGAIGWARARRAQYPIETAFSVSSVGTLCSRRHLAS